jgi:L-threonylcarbamoyladenylate synthase
VNTLLTQSPDTAAAIIRSGGIVAFPTETVYGLGAAVFDEVAIHKIYEAKNRPADNPLIAHIGHLDQIGELASVVTPIAQKLIDAFFPGPLTVVLPKTDAVPAVVTAGLNSVGIRMPSTSIAREFIRACGVPIVAPSANLSGRPSPTTWQAVREDLDGRIDCILQGDPTVIGLESTVVDCTSEVPVLLRKGGISIDEVREIVSEVVEADSDALAGSRSPGLRHRHYSPAARVVIVDTAEQLAATSADAYIGLRHRTEPFALKIECGGVGAYAREVFEFFRECDRADVERIFCEAVPEDGIGAALMDRLRRAAAA